MSYGRRSSSDPKWKRTKKIVDGRDRNQCRFLMCITAVEERLLKRGSEKSLDRAHIFSAGKYPSEIYNPNNVVLLMRFIHRRMDGFQNPLTGDPIDDLNEHYYWWWRIKNRSSQKFDRDTDYKSLLMADIGLKQD